MSSPTLASLPRAEIDRRLRGQGLWFDTPPFTVCLHSPLPQIGDGLLRVYADYPLAEAGMADFHLSLRPARSPEGWWRRGVLFDADGRTPFTALPVNQAFAMLEWGLNWCISNRMHQYLIIHAAMLERHGKGIILVGEPGAGKSTLSAALMQEGWRLLSDEITVIDAERQLRPVPRPVSLKNSAIDLIHQRYADAILTDTAHNTTKGNVAHLKPSASSLQQAGETVAPALILFPRYSAGTSLRIARISRGDTLMRMVEGAFNYHLLGAEGFERLADTIEHCACHELEYSELDALIPALDSLVDAS